MKTVEKLSITLPPKLADMVRQKVEGGSYSSNSEVIREALRLMEERDRIEFEKLQTLRAEIQKGLESGNAGPLNFDELRDTARKQLEQER